MAEPRGISQLEWRTTDSAPEHIRFETAFGKLGRFSTTSEKSLTHCASGEMVSINFKAPNFPGIPAKRCSLAPQECQDPLTLSSLIGDPNATEAVDLVILLADW